MRITMETKCDTCVGYKDGWCQINKHATNAINYGCRQHITQEEFDKRMAEVDKKLNEQKAIRVNYMLTMMYTFLNAGLTLMTKSETIFDELVSGKNWRLERKKAMKKMMANMEEVIRYSLRRGDAAARCSATQYVIMLPRANYENRCLVCDRILRAYYHKFSKMDAEIRYEVFPIQPDDKENFQWVRESFTN